MTQSNPETAASAPNLGESFADFSARVAQLQELLLSNEALREGFYTALAELQAGISAYTEREMTHLETESHERSEVGVYSDDLAARVEVAIKGGNKLSPLFSPQAPVFPSPKFKPRPPSLLVTNAQEVAQLLNTSLERFKAHATPEVLETDLLKLRHQLDSLPASSPLKTLVDFHLLPALNATLESLKTNRF